MFSSLSSQCQVTKQSTFYLLPPASLFSFCNVPCLFYFQLYKSYYGEKILQQSDCESNLQIGSGLLSYVLGNQWQIFFRFQGFPDCCISCSVLQQVVNTGQTSFFSLRTSIISGCLHNVPIIPMSLPVLFLHSIGLTGHKKIKWYQRKIQNVYSRPKPAVSGISFNPKGISFNSSVSSKEPHTAEV